MAKTKPVVMTVAGFDPTAGAGVLADIKTISAFDCYGVAVVTAITFQDTDRVYDVTVEPPEHVAREMDLLFSDFEVAAVKTGMLGSAAIVEAVARKIESEALAAVVIDPVVTSSSGADLAGDSVRTAVELLFPLAAVVTPNIKEAERLSGIEIRTLSDMEEAARRIIRTGPRAVVVKGGDLSPSRLEEPDTARVSDLLLDREGVRVFEGARISSSSTHGTGCAFASVIASQLALGVALRPAIETAKAYVREAIATAPGLGRGHGPLNHFVSRP